MTTPSGDEVRVHGALERLVKPTAKSVSAFLGDVDVETVQAICLDKKWKLHK